MCIRDSTLGHEIQSSIMLRSVVYHGASAVQIADALKLLHVAVQESPAVPRIQVKICEFTSAQVISNRLD